MNKLALIDDDFELLSFFISENTLAPIFNAGDEVIVDPNRPFIDGCFVVVESLKKRVQLCRYCALAKGNELQSLDGKPVEDRYTICGVVIFKGKQYN